MTVHILGIRHHGVGSAKNVRAQLAALKPDLILVEGPPEISEVLPVVGKPGLKTPVAIMVYNSVNPKESAFYPFVEYSPEWVSILYANKNNIPVRSIDLPASIGFTLRAEMKNNEEEAHSLYKDPLSYMADISGHKSGEEWWEYHFEQLSTNVTEHFEAVQHVMDTLRSEGIPSSLDAENVAREAYMRMLIRQAQNEMYTNIVVVCGAWHTPALSDLEQTAKSDLKIIKSLPKPKIKVTSTWIPWTNDRLSMFSGYGAGIYSPGWYEHQWLVKTNTEIKWLSKVANLLREKGIDISTSHVIEAFTLSFNLAKLRNKYYVSLAELNDAVLSVMCMGDAILLELIRKDLIIGNKLGQVPEDIPKVPLQEDFEQQIKSLRLKLTAEQKQHDLDLRKELDLQRSIFFFRLEILKIKWARRTQSRTKGTFKESWIAEWSPDMMIELIDKAFLGNTIQIAAHSVVMVNCENAQAISEITDLIKLTIPSELFECIDALLRKIVALSSISTDIVDLMKSLPNLIEVSRYGNVRKSDLAILNTIVQQLLIKVFVGLPNACYGLDEDNSNQVFLLISRMNDVIRLYDEPESLLQWYETLHKLIDKEGVHPIILGCVCRMLLDARELSDQEADNRISFALSPANDPYRVAAWLEGFLKGYGMILIYDNRLWNLIYSWVALLTREVFMEVLPLLRRTFSTFEYGERKQIGWKAKRGIVYDNLQAQKTNEGDFDNELAVMVLPVVQQLGGF